MTNVIATLREPPEQIRHFLKDDPKRTAVPVYSPSPWSNTTAIFLESTDDEDCLVDKMTAQGTIRHRSRFFFRQFHPRLDDRYAPGLPRQSGR
ncbi:hypothetical protein [Rhodospirillaceae bacterium SYSU D60014]|uniref:hypothetical protein n=1 Tax=Virgifigura deserti TaxID=2268457 RepID=UPI0013C4A926